MKVLGTHKAIIQYTQQISCFPLSISFFGGGGGGGGRRETISLFFENNNLLFASFLLLFVAIQEGQTKLRDGQECFRNDHSLPPGRKPVIT